MHCQAEVADLNAGAGGGKRAGGGGAGGCSVQGQGRERLPRERERDTQQGVLPQAVSFGRSPSSHLLFPFTCSLAPAHLQHAFPLFSPEHQDVFQPSGRSGALRTGESAPALPGSGRAGKGSWSDPGRARTPAPARSLPLRPEGGEHHGLDEWALKVSGWGAAHAMGEGLARLAPSPPTRC